MHCTAQTRRKDYMVKYGEKYRTENEKYFKEYFKKYREDLKKHATESVTTGTIIDKHKWDLWCTKIKCCAKKNPYSDDSSTSSAKGVDAISNFSWIATCSNSYDDQNLGKVMIMTMNSMNHVHVCTCIEMPCTNDSNRLEVKIYYN
jgi:uncharacterized protein YnzC (UPF0291/DUF896 family)